jgi:argininosuccinate synthase
MLARDLLSPKIAQLVYNGFWYSPEMNLMMDFVRKTQENVTGTARVRLYKGNCMVVGRRAPKSLYDEKISTFDEDQGAYQQSDAGAFIKLNALRLRVRKNAGL